MDSNVSYGKERRRKLFIEFFFRRRRRRFIFQSRKELASVEAAAENLSPSLIERSVLYCEL
jgi:hypothetical protein